MNYADMSNDELLREYSRIRTSNWGPKARGLGVKNVLQLAAIKRELEKRGLSARASKRFGDSIEQMIDRVLEES